MNMVLLGWTWAFNNRAPRLAWSLLAATVVAYVVFVVFASGVIVALGAVFSLGLGGFANKQIEYSLKRRGYALLERDINTTSGDLVIDGNLVIDNANAPFANSMY
jgi:hypothetical protein